MAIQRTSGNHCSRRSDLKTQNEGMEFTSTTHGTILPPLVIAPGSMMTSWESGLSLFIQPSTFRTLILNVKYGRSIAFSVKRHWLHVRASANLRILSVRRTKFDRSKRYRNGI
ncbi:hypothetical protein RHSP_83494 [Rhizobium freirei PRF 81]|uniref:Uncharacterized protein n=2 Tax=Rhizobium TaxID=379 RepID=Q5EWX5_RHITR|nr:unknown [Rhizobium leucaenae USDA 9039]AGB73525.1 hypothetical protein RTCIAT899_PB01265 [Rhizobium tropici CIAT 899]AYG70449.1 hypothetical protein CCGE531_30905 [Rhizobium sp. CCGE531]AYG76926.1 hypothetical protein CCGE532_31060 [Rhizobium sp. CCGE532]ENN84780.1 hypothetical protein RHSP_83494 [Rhizobium freirei PRF 81]NEV15324.1 hypothetical protein [Rhizobium tropici]TGE87979.1 hypothetical protein C9417_31425 [Rhizobium sp. SEMIA 4088]